MADVPTLSEHQVDAMNALFDFGRAVTEGGLSIHDLQEVMAVAIADGHDLLLIALIMAKTALERTGRLSEAMLPTDDG